MISRRLRSVALTGVLLAVTAAAPSAALAQGTPDQIIDAKANPDQAADALNSGCQTLSNCKRWDNDTQFNRPKYGAPSILGDVIYNCSTHDYAETAVGVEDERQETTSVSEKVSLKVSLSFLDLAKSSAEFEAFSKQSESFSTSVSVTNAVVVPPGYKGWTVTRILTGTVTGSAYVTQGIDQLIQVKNIDLSFPGYRDPDDQSDDPVLYTGIKQQMDADDIEAACSNLGTTVNIDQLLTAAQAQSKFKLTLCRGSRRCTSRKVAGSLPPRVRRARALLTRAGRTYGQGTYLRRQTKLDLRRPLKPGRYKLTLRERPVASERGPGRLSAIKTIVPITVA